MQSEFEPLLSDPIYRHWFRVWWDADWSVEGLERRSIEWRLPHLGPARSEFGGRTWSVGRMPPHDPDGNFNSAFLSQGWVDWDSFFQRARASGRTEYRLDGAWFRSLTPGQGRQMDLSARQAFVRGDATLNSAGLSRLTAKGLYVGGKMQLVDASLRERAVLTRAVIRNGIDVRKVSGSTVHLNDAIVEGGVVAETLSELDISKARISGDVHCRAGVARLDGFEVVIDGDMRINGSGGPRVSAVLRRAKLSGKLAVENASLAEFDVGGGAVRGHFIVHSSNIETVIADRVTLQGDLKVQDATISACRLRNANVGGALTLAGATVGAAGLEGAVIGGKASVTGCSFRTLDAAAIEFKDAATFDRTSFAEALSFNSARFGGPASFAGAAFLGRATFVKARFEAAANFGAEPESQPGSVVGGDRFGSVSFQASSFVAGRDAIWCVDFDGRQFRGSSVFDGCSFHGAPRFFQATFHENASFRYTRFARAPHPTFRERRIAFGRHARVGTAVRATLNAWNKEHQQYEHSYRSLKLRMNQIGAAREERRFLALELRARRARLDQEVRPLESLLSILYDLTSDYGESIVRPLAWTAVVTLAAAGAYYAAAFPTAEPLQATEFAIRQIFRPFNVWADGGAAIGPPEPQTFADILLGRRSAAYSLSLGMKFVASLQSLCCLTLLFLSALAIRKRFRLT
jgi:uncharacterized protein YjbI with pentapeptide repeats